MKRIALALALVFLSSCAREYVFEEPVREAKKESPFWWVLQKKETGAAELHYEDKWYSYEAEFDYIKPGDEIMRNVIYGQCPIESAEYKVTDKETHEVLRMETFNQIPCDPCHRR
jgi:hypothetical protein